MPFSTECLVEVLGNLSEWVKACRKENFRIDQQEYKSS